LLEKRKAEGMKGNIKWGAGGHKVVKKNSTGEEGQGATFLRGGKKKWS